MKILRRALFCIIIVLAFSSISIALSTEPDFTEEEKQFISEHPVIRLCVDPEFVPYEFIDTDGIYKGIAADYVKIISEKTGIQMVVENELTWAEAYEAVVEKRLDVLPCIAKTVQREQYFLFSEPYIDFQRVIVVQNTNQTIKDMNDLYNAKVAVQTNSSHHGFLKAYPEIEQSLYPSVQNALAAVSNGSESAYIGNLATSSYLIKKNGFVNLKYIILPSRETQSLYFAVRNDWPELVTIINKGLESITQEEKIAINNKWIGVEKDIDYSLIFQIIALILAFLVISIFWTVRLKREVTKRIMIEEELVRAKQEAEIANQIKSSFLARMSHEIRTPLNAITGMAYLMKRTDINVAQRMYLDKITQASYTMLGIINDILDFSKIEAGKVELERISFNLDHVIQQVINIISFKVEEQQIEFRMSKDPKIPADFFGDPKRIEQILINLISNAVKFTSNGEVSMEVSLTAREENSCDLEFRIRDTGIGMSKEEVDQLFTPFAQGDSSINRRFGGTGLGLSIVKSLTEIMGGEIEVASAPGIGSTFAVKLSLEIDCSGDKEEQQKILANYFREIKALVLDKSSTERHLIETYLGSFGIAVELTESGSIALELISSPEKKGVKPINLIIVGYDTPLEGGLEFVKQLRSNPLIPSNLKVMLTIPLMREDIFQQLEESGVNLGITKPVIPSILYNGILELFQFKTLELEKAIPSARLSVSRQTGNSYHILVVEDNKTNQFIAKTILEQARFHVSLAENGEEGVSFYRDHRKEIDLILMDLHMPVLNGKEASVIIRTLDPTVPIVAMTADAITGIEEECRRAGINYYVSKPYDPEALVDTLLQILEPQAEQGVVGEDRTDKPPAKEIEILDVEDGLKRIGSSMDLYQRILREYLNENKDVSETLKQAIDMRNYQEAIQIVHKSKGGSGNIGAKTLSLIAAELQKALAEGADAKIQQLYAEFDRSIRRLFVEIEKILLEESS